ncbi:MAG: hypothetical protein PHX93_03005 [Candidatus Peribacteraceae bacterium]|nr:hypothetical protein [Candidatus Peribacteraceae bacterium]
MNETPPSLLHQMYPKMMAAEVKEQPRGEALRARQEDYRAELLARHAYPPLPDSSNVSDALLHRWSQPFLPRIRSIFHSGAYPERLPSAPTHLPGKFPPVYAIPAGTRQLLGYLMSGRLLPRSGPPPPLSRQSFLHPRRPFGP